MGIVVGASIPQSARRGVIGLMLTVAMLAGVSAEADVRRRLTVRSNPPGALVYIDDQQIGATPASTSFIYYGTRKIQLIKDGYKTITVQQTFSPPWYQVPPLDFFSENFYSGELRDERVLDFELELETIPPTHELRERAESLRSSARAGMIAPPLLGAPAAVAAPAPGTFSAPLGAPGAVTAPAPPSPHVLPPPMMQPAPTSQPFFDSPAPQLLPRPIHPNPMTTLVPLPPPFTMPAPGPAVYPAPTGPAATGPAATGPAVRGPAPTGPAGIRPLPPP